MAMSEDALSKPHPLKLGVARSSKRSKVHSDEQSSALRYGGSSCV